MKNINRRSITILVADDDADDRLMISEALHENGLAGDLKFVVDGGDLMHYLRRKEKYTDPDSSPRPKLILLDLNMPKMDGYEALKEIKNDPDLKSIPVVVLTTSKTEEDIYRTYNLGVNSFITKPVTFESLVAIIAKLGQYWLEIVELPKEPHH